MRTTQARLELEQSARLINVLRFAEIPPDADNAKLGAILSKARELVTGVKPLRG